MKQPRPIRVRLLLCIAADVPQPGWINARKAGVCRVGGPGDKCAVEGLTLAIVTTMSSAAAGSVTVTIEIESDDGQVVKYDEFKIDPPGEVSYCMSAIPFARRMVFAVGDYVVRARIGEEVLDEIPLEIYRDIAPPMSRN